MNFLGGGLETEHLDREGPFAFRKFQRVSAVIVGGAGQLFVAADSGYKGAREGAILGSDEAALGVNGRLGQTHEVQAE